MFVIVLFTRIIINWIKLTIAKRTMTPTTRAVPMPVQR